MKKSTNRTAEIGWDRFSHAINPILYRKDKGGVRRIYHVTMFGKDPRAIT